MKLFFESFNYPKSVITDCFGESLARQITKRTNSMDTLQIDCVGYFLQRDGDKCEPCFIMPKVFVWQREINGKDVMCAFGFEKWSTDSSNTFKEPFSLDKLYVEEIKKQWSDDKTGWKLDVVYELPMWIYSAMAKYSNKQYKNSSALIESDIQSLLTSKRVDDESTLLDAALALKFFYQANRNLFVFVWKTAHSGYNKVKWTKTIRKVTPFINGDDVIYPYVVNNKKHINWDEQLMCIYFNTLRFVNRFHNIDVRFNEPYALEPESVFARKAKGGQIAKTLKRIKSNYFSDKMQLLWKLLYNYHAKLHKFMSSNSEQDYLLIRSFNNVFEDMIDELLGDNEKSYPIDLKKQKDGKIVDHLFRHDSLIPLSHEEAEQIFYIGDSKYYRDNSAPTGVALYKQYTYAKNILQAHFNWYNFNNKEDYKLYRDDRTEGYNIIPNFFLSGYVRPDKKETDYGLDKDEEINSQLEEKPNYQWKNRLFDRDTLFLRQYDVNFLFVLHAYINNNVSECAGFKKEAKKEFKEDFLDYLNGKYEFYSLIIKDNLHIGVEVALRVCFREVVGKVFMPYNDNTLILALEKASASSEEYEKTINSVSVFFERVAFNLGESIPTSLPSDPSNDDKIISIRNKHSYVDYLESFNEEISRAAEDISDILNKSREEHKEKETHITHTNGKPKSINYALEKYYDEDIDDSEKYVKYMPVTTVKAACGQFIDNDPMTIDYWLKIEDTGNNIHGKDFVIVQAKGRSMEDKIHDGDLCIIQLGCAYFPGDIVLACIHDLDESYGGRFSIKKYDREKAIEDGQYVRTKILLNSLNKDYPNYEFTKDDEGVGIIGVFRGVIAK